MTQDITLKFPGIISVMEKMISVEFQQNLRWGPGIKLKLIILILKIITFNNFSTLELVYRFLFKV